MRQLTPRYLFALPTPVTIYGQDWCYDSGGSYYRLGYVTREHWSSPNLIGRHFTASPGAPNLPPIWQSKINQLEALY